MSLKLGILGIDHGHIFEMLQYMLDEGCSCETWWSEGDSATLEGFIERFPDCERVEDRSKILADPSIDMILISAVPADRADLAIEAMRAGKDVMVDKPGCTTFEQLDALKECVGETGRIWSVNFSERFQVPAVTKADELIRAGAIGRVIQTLGTGPHKLGNYQRPDWFFNRSRYGGILCDIGSHQIDQYLHFTGSDTVEIALAHVENTSQPNHPGFQDFGEISLHGDRGNGYIRVDWFTPSALPVWGDGRLFIVGEEGTIELRKYIDIARQGTGDHLYLVNGETVEHIDCRDCGMPYFSRLVQDVTDRSDTAGAQAHTFRVMELALQAQDKAEAHRG